MSRVRAPRHRIRTPRALALAGFVACAQLLATGCGLHDARVTIVNESGAALDSLRLLGEFGEKRVAPLAPGASVTVRLGIKGEDAIALRGRVGGGAIVPVMPVYVEAGNETRLRVDAAGVVRPESRAGY